MESRSYAVHGPSIQADSGDFGSPSHLRIQDSISLVDFQQLSELRHLSVLQSLDVLAVQDVGL